MRISNLFLSHTVSVDSLPGVTEHHKGSARLYCPECIEMCRRQTSYTVATVQHRLTKFSLFCGATVFLIISLIWIVK